MQYFPNPLDRWLKTQANLLGESAPLRESWNVEGWQIKVFSQPADPIQGENWPPIAIVATPGDSDLRSKTPNQTWLIFPHKTQVISTKASGMELSLPAESTDILSRILGTTESLELRCFRNPTPVFLIPHTDETLGPWVAWRLPSTKQDSSTLGWELLVAVLDRLGAPPKMILDDWKKQLEIWKLIPQDCMIEDCIQGLAHQLLVSKSGLLIPLREFRFHHQILPAEATSLTPSRLVATPPIDENKPKMRQAIPWVRIGLGLSILATIVLLTGSITLEKPTPWHLLAQEESPGPSMLEQYDEPRSSDPASDPDSASTGQRQPNKPEIFKTDLDGYTEPTPNLDLEPSSIESLVQNTLDANIRVASFLDSQGSDPPTTDQQTTSEDLPAPNQNQVAQGGLDQDAGDSKESMLVISQSTQKREFRVGRGFSPKKAKGFFTLELEQGLQDKLHVIGPQTQELVGESSGSWKITMDELEPELVLTIQSKPGPKWQVSYMVQIPSEPTGPLVSLGPKEPAIVLGRLSQYHQWLQQSADQWKYATPQAGRPGQLSPVQLARMYSAKQKQTEHSIKRWRQIEQLAVMVFDSVRVQVDLQPQPVEAP